MLFVVLCPGTPEGSTGSGSGFKASQKTGQRLKVSFDRLGEAGNRTCDAWFTRHGLSLYIQTLHYDCSHIEHVHPIFCADSIIFLSVALRHYYIYTTFGVLILCSFSQWLYMRIVSFTYS